MGLGLEQVAGEAQSQGSAPGPVPGLDAVPVAPGLPVPRLPGQASVGCVQERGQIDLDGDLDQGRCGLAPGLRGCEEFDSAATTVTGPRPIRS